LVKFFVFETLIFGHPESNETMPDDFKAKYPTTRVIIDYTEVCSEMPSSLLLNSELFTM